MLTDNAIHYTLSHLLKVAMPSHEAIPFAVARNEHSVTVCIREQLTVSFALLSDQEAAQLLRGNATLTHVPSTDGKADIPVFQSSLSEHAQPIVNGNGELEIPYDLVTPSFLLLSRMEEEGHPRDTHGRFCYQDSLAKHYDFIHLPLVDEYAMLLRKWITELLKPELDIIPRQHQFIPSHDIDLLNRFQSPWQAFKSIAGRDLLLEYSWKATAQSIREYRRWRADSRQDPYITAILELVRQSEERHLSSVFFFKAQHSGEPDSTYDIENPNVRYCIDTILEADMKVGLHGSYRSYVNTELFGVEKARLEKIAGTPITHSRQHYLRFGPGTLPVWQACGITDDYTLCYAEQPGFRCGTCHPYPLYDLANDCVTNITEHPLIVMDGSLLEYLHASMEESNGIINRLRARCEAVEGDFIILWHNHLLSRNYRTAYYNIYVHQLNK
ncbi:MAG: polysaccharide deacetylase family protein [Bacteroidales bacterium]|nr:polysaccharide deacetylase family protein [Bacteroidales bacterium]